MSAEEVKADMDSLAAMAKRLGLKGEEATKYVHEHMTKLGYKNRRSYYRDDKDGGNSSGSWSFFGNSKSSDDDD